MDFVLCGPEVDPRLVYTLSGCLVDSLAWRTRFLKFRSAIHPPNTQPHGDALRGLRGTGNGGKIDVRLFQISHFPTVMETSGMFIHREQSN